MTGYRPMTLADLAGRLMRMAEGKVRWKLVWEFDGPETADVSGAYAFQISSPCTWTRIG